jgi:hypothetical protein
MVPPSSFDDTIDDALTMQNGAKSGIGLDFLIWKRKAKSTVDPEGLADLMRDYYLDEAALLDDPMAKTLTIMAIGIIDFDAIAIELIETTQFEKDTKN